MNPKYDHDIEQAYRRTKAQNRAIIRVVNHALPEEPEAPWGYTDIPPEGGTVVVMSPTGKTWEIDREGTIEQTA